MFSGFFYLIYPRRFLLVFERFRYVYTLIGKYLKKMVKYVHKSLVEVCCMAWKGPDRRKKGRGDNKLLNFLTIICWTVFVSSLIVFHYARPEMESILVKFWNLPIRRTWEPFLKDILFGLLIFCSVMSFISMAINQRYLKRVEDHFRFNYLLLFLVSVGFIVSIF